MAATGTLEHSVLELDGWAGVGEVIGTAPHWRTILELLFASSEHRRILLDCDYDITALGFVFNNGVWLTGRLFDT